MTTTDWTLERELRDIANAPTLGQAFLALRVGTEESELVQLTDWERGGAETYILHFKVVTNHIEERFLLKACVALGSLDGTAGIVREWLDRRRAVEQLGCLVSRVHGVANSTVLEEFIPYGLFDLIATSKARLTLIRELGRTVGLLTRAGFPCFSLRDLRTHGTDVVLVDFGEDLGSESSARPQSVILDDVLRLLSPTAPTELELVELSRTFEMAVELGI